MNTKKLSGVQIGILILGAATGLIHLVLLSLLMGKLDVLFTLNGLGYLAFLAAYFLPLPIVKDQPRLVKWAFILFTLVTIIAWVFMGEKSLPAAALGYITKLIEIGLIACLWVDRH